MLRAFVVTALLLCVAPAAAQEAALQDTSLFITFVPNIQFSPVYVAMEKGYFAAEGLSVVIEHGDEPVGVDLIAAGEREFGLIGGEQVITARANHRPVVFVYEWFQKFPVGIVVTNESGIETVTDLAGRHVGIPGRFGASYSGLIALLNANDMSENDIIVEEIGFNAPEVICVGALQASVVYLNNEPLQVEQRIAGDSCGAVTGVHVFPVSDYIDLVSNGLITSERMIAEQPERVASMVRAYDAGLRDIIRNPAEAYLLSAVHVENLPLGDEFRAALVEAAVEQVAFLSEHPDVSREELAAYRSRLYAGLAATFPPEEIIQFRVLIATIEFWDADRLGYTEPASWEAMQDTLLKMGFITEPIALDEAYTNAFLPPVADEVEE